MPAISRIRLCNVVYENGGKRYNDHMFMLDGQNSVVLLENGGGKTVLIQAILQAVIPHISMADRKIKNTLYLENGPAHVAVEWILQDQPRRYGMTCVSLYVENNNIHSLKYVYEYNASDEHDIEGIPFSLKSEQGQSRPATRGEIGEYYNRMVKNNPYAKGFNTIKEYNDYIEEQFKIIPSEWRKIATINSGEGNVDEYFNRCKTTDQLLNQLLIPVIEEGLLRDSANGFADTFEKQREHFKKNRILQEKIEQSQGAKEKIDGYVKLYGDYQSHSKSYYLLKSQVHGYMNVIEDKKEDLISQRDELELRRQGYEDLKKDYEYQEKGLEIRILKDKQVKIQREVDILESRIHELTSEKDLVSERRQNILLSKVSKEIDQAQSRIEELKGLLSKEDENFDLRRLKTLIEENASNIKGYYTYEIELIQREIEEITKKIELKNKELEEMQELLKELNEREIGIRGSITRLKAKSEIRHEDMSLLYKSIFGEELGRNVEDQLIELQMASKELYRNRNTRTQGKTELQSEWSRGNTHIEDYTKERYVVLEGLAHLEEENKYFNKQYTLLTKELSPYEVSLKSVEDLYTKENSIQDNLAIKLERIITSLDDAYLNFYGLTGRVKSDNLLSMSLHKIIPFIREKYPNVISGIEYLNQYAIRENLQKGELIQKYPLFPYTLIVNSMDKEAIMALIESEEDRVLEPVILISMDQMNGLLEDESLMLDGVIPEYWHAFMDETLKEEYLRKMNGDIDEIQKTIHDLKDKEKAIGMVTSLLQEFLSEFPYGKYMELQSKITGYNKSLKDIEDKLDDLEEKQLELENSVEKEAAALESIEIQLDANIRLQANIEQYIDLEHEYIKDRDQEEAYQEELNELLLIKNNTNHNIQGIQNTIRDLHKSISDYEYEKRAIEDKPIYKEVKGSTPICDNVDIDVLIERREVLKGQLAGISVDRNTLEFKLKESQKLLDHYSDQQRRLTKEALYPVKVIEVYYTNEEDDLFDKIMVLQNESKDLEKKLKQWQQDLWQSNAKKQLLLQELPESVLEDEIFDGDKEVIKERLTILRRTLKDTDYRIKGDTKLIFSQLSQYDQWLTEFMIKDSLHNFTLVPPKKVSKDKVEGVSQDHGKLKKVFDDLDYVNSKDKEWIEQLRSLRQNVIDYCKENLSDIRLREAIIDGLVHKKDYEALLSYQERMSEIIHKSIVLANEDKRESDRELSTFLNHILTYVVMILDELKELEKKTTIELEDGFKQIFIIDVPEYEVTEAKEGIRRHLDKMISYFDTISNEEEEAVRNMIEDALSVENLIPVVLNFNQIKVKCRKVTNDLKIGQAPMSWEHSNRWSGGEKWSKNMTLFLGILNYLAEKKQHLSGKQKRNRTVILDNPFGKASSKHVLDPVFFIAEKLGFQIIALTAHAEGQFISDYFPVVYSLRLRDSVKAGKKIVDGERTLNYTYLKENAPKSIDRLQTVQQLNLF